MVSPVQTSPTNHSSSSYTSSSSSSSLLGKHKRSKPALAPDETPPSRGASGDSYIPRKKLKTDFEEVSACVSQKKFYIYQTPLGQMSEVSSFHIHK